MQRKLASIIEALTGTGADGGDDGRNGYPNGDDLLGGVRSPDGYEPPEGIDSGGFTAYGSGINGMGGGHSAWGGPVGGGTTPYGATPYGQSGYGF